MEPFTIALAVSAIAGLAGAHMASESARKGRDQAESFQRESMQRLESLGVPSIEAQKMLPQIMEYIGDFTPEQLQTIAQDPSALENINVDPVYKQNQMKALSSLSQLADKGLTEEDMAAFELARRQSAADATSNQNKILTDMQRKGLSGSGAELIANLQAGQAASDRLQQADLEQARIIADQRKQAIRDLANTSGQMRSQDFSEQAKIAEAKDAIARFNAQNAQSVAAQNVGVRNTAGMRNLEERQRIGNAQHAANYQNDAYNKGLYQQRFQNELSKAGGQNAISQSMAQTAMANAANQGAAYAGGANAIGKAAGAMSQMNFGTGSTGPQTPAVTKGEFNWAKENQWGEYDPMWAPSNYKGPR